MWGRASYEQAHTKESHIALERKCVIFLITGERSVGLENRIWSWITIPTKGEGHIVENESSLHLRKLTAVVIIYY